MFVVHDDAAWVEPAPGSDTGVTSGGDGGDGSDGGEIESDQVTIVIHLMLSRRASRLVAVINPTSTCVGTRTFAGLTSDSQGVQNPRRIYAMTYTRKEQRYFACILP